MNLIGHAAAFFLLTSIGSPLRGTQVAIIVTDESGKSLPCRVHLSGPDGKPVRPPQYCPFWFDHFVCDGQVVLELDDGEFHYEIEHGPEYESKSGTWKIGSGASEGLPVTLRRIANLASEGWWSGDLHVHRPVGIGSQPLHAFGIRNEIDLHLRAEELHIAQVITWWNQRSFWKDHILPNVPLEEPNDGRFFHLLAGEDERGGGALLFFNLAHPSPLPAGGRDHPEHPSSMIFLEAAKREPGAWVDIEKPFWLDAPMWFASGLADSVGIVHNHMNRSGVMDNEAWGRARDGKDVPGPHGNGLWTQEIYYHLLNCGVRLPPSAGGASGVLPNPVGYNRVYVRVDGALTWEKWWNGLRAGRVFVTNGPLLRVRANGEWPGHVFQAAAGETLRLGLDALLEGRDPMPQFEIIKNGRVERRVPAGSPPGELTFTESGWFLVRVIASVPETFRFASTGPFYVEVGANPRRVSRKSAQFFADWMRDRIDQLRIEDPLQREDTTRPLRAAEEWWRNKAAAATTEE